MLVAGWGEAGSVLVVRVLENIFFTQKPRITYSWGGRMGRVMLQSVIWFPSVSQPQDPR